MWGLEKVLLQLYLQRDAPLSMVSKESSLKLSDPRKIMGRDGTKLKQQLIMNHTEKQYTLAYTRTMLNILPLFHLFHMTNIRPSVSRGVWARPLVCTAVRVGGLMRGMWPAGYRG